MTDVFSLIILVSLMMFGIGLCGICVNIGSAVRSLMCIELMLLAVSIMFVVFSVKSQSLDGHVFCLFIFGVAAAESAIGLAIVVAHFKKKGDIMLENLRELKK